MESHVFVWFDFTSDQQNSHQNWSFQLFIPSYVNNYYRMTRNILWWHLQHNRIVSNIRMTHKYTALQCWCYWIFVSNINAEILFFLKKKLLASLMLQNKWELLKSKCRRFIWYPRSKIIYQRMNLFLIEVEINVGNYGMSQWKVSAKNLFRIWIKN